MRVVATIEKLRMVVKQARAAGRTVGLVPTMGALHAGHASLIDRCARDRRFTVVSIFVNPSQFGPKEDFNKYPRPLSEDLRICRKHKADVVFVPGVRQMYSKEQLTWVNVDKLSEPLCGRFRPGHFRGVATVCAKLFNIVQPDIAYFGRKDAQQLAIVKRMAADLNMPIRIVSCPTIREADGLAMSSRNRYLSAEQRRDAASIYRAFGCAREMAASGVRDTRRIIAQVRRTIQKAPSLRQIDYISIVDGETLQELRRIKGKAILAVAVRMASTRLIDNIVLDDKSS